MHSTNMTMQLLAY